MKKFAKTVIAAVVLAGCAAGAAHAAVDASTITTQTATLVFATPSVLTHTLTPVGTLPLTLADNTTLANGFVTRSDGSNAFFAFRWTPGTAVVDGKIGTVSGINDDSHKLVARFNDGTSSHSFDGWYEPTEDTVPNWTYRLEASGAQTVAADSYVVSVDAAIWNE